MSADALGSINLRVHRTGFFAPTASGAADLRSDPLLAEWDALARRALALPFVRPQWVAAWWQAFAEPGEQLALWYVRGAGRVMALLPVVHSDGGLRSATNYHTPQASVLAENADAAETLVRALLKDGGANETILAALDARGTDMRACERAARGTGHMMIALPHERSCFIPLAGDWDAYSATLGRDISRDVHRRRRRLQELGRVVIDINDGHDNLPSLLDTAIAIEGSGWKLRNGTAILSDPRVEWFYGEIARWAAQEGMLRLCFLRVDGKPLAMQFALEHALTWHMLKCGYDEKYHHASPGKVLLHDCIRHCFDTGMARVELHGDQEAYKLNWKPQQRQLQRVHLFSPSLAGRLAWARAALRPWLKSWALRFHLLPPAPSRAVQP